MIVMFYNKFRDSRFNRYMVECEYCSALQQRFHAYGFNRYMVECESKSKYS